MHEGDSPLQSFGAALGQKRLLILDPSLHGEVGHHYNHVRALTEAARRKRIPTLILSYKICDERVRSSLPVVPHFGLHPYAKPNLHTSTEEDYAILNEVFLQFLNSMPVKVTANDVVLFPTVNQNQLLAIPVWMASLLQSLSLLEPELSPENMPWNDLTLAVLKEVNG